MVPILPFVPFQKKTMAAENTSKRKAPTKKKHVKHDGLLGDFFAHGLGHEFTDGRMGLLGLAEVDCVFASGNEVETLEFYIDIIGIARILISDILIYFLAIFEVPHLHNMALFSCPIPQYPSSLIRSSNLSRANCPNGFIGNDNLAPILRIEHIGFNWIKKRPQTKGETKQVFSKVSSQSSWKKTYDPMTPPKKISAFPLV